MTQIISNIFFLLVGMYIMRMVMLYNKNKEIRSQILKLNKPFEQLLIDFKNNKYFFEKRINNIIYFKHESKENGKSIYAIFTLDTAVISLFADDTCFAVSSSINNESLKESILLEMRKYSAEYNDVVTYNDYIVSRNMIEPKKKNKKGKDKDKVIYNLDDILDKISKHGLDKLTEGEKEYLDKYGK